MIWSSSVRARPALETRERVLAANGQHLVSAPVWVFTPHRDWRDRSLNVCWNDLHLRAGMLGGTGSPGASLRAGDPVVRARSAHSDFPMAFPSLPATSA